MSCIKFQLIPETFFMSNPFCLKHSNVQLFVCLEESEKKVLRLSLIIENNLQLVK